MYPIAVFKLGWLSASLPDGNAPVLELGNFNAWAKCVGAITLSFFFNDSPFKCNGKGSFSVG